MDSERNSLDLVACFSLLPTPFIPKSVRLGDDSFLVGGFGVLVCGCRMDHGSCSII
jgi:hypothetical protein